MLDRTERDILVSIETLMQSVSKSQDDHETRIRRLEVWQWKVAGGASVVGGLVVSVVSALLQHGAR